MKKLWILFTLFLLGCSPASISTPTLVPATSTKVSTPTLIPTSTVTPYPPLQTEGPYLLFTRDESNFTIIDADGTGRKQFQLPNDGYILSSRQSSFQNAFSPDGKWLAYFTGELLEEPYDLTLHLFNLEDETTFMVAKILSSDYPENLINVKTADVNPNHGCQNEDCLIGVIQLAFIQGIESLDWSPDSKSLAFAAQIDAPSSDVYIFDLETKSTRRLVADNENVWLIDWSPNGEKILFGNSLADTDYIPMSTYIADPNIKNVQSPKALYSGRFLYQFGWLNEKLWLFSSGGEGAPAHNFKVIDIFTQEIKIIWKYEAESLTIDSENNRIILANPLDEEDQPRGIYILRDNGSFQKISNEFYYIYEQQDASDLYFGLQKLNERSQLVSIPINGQVSVFPIIASYYYPPITSPDKNWILIQSINKIELYSNKLELVNTWKNIEAIEIIWTPNSLGAYIIEEEQSYYISVLNGEITEANLCEDCYPFKYIWLP